MKDKVMNVWCVFKLTFDEFNKDKASQMAAAQAYFTIFALPPLLILLAMLLGFFLDDATIQKQILNQAHALGGEAASGSIKEIFANAKAQEGNSFWAGLISVGILVFSATNIFAQLQSSLDTIWGVELKPDVGIKKTIFNRLLGLGLIISLAFVVVVSMISDVALALVQNFVAERLGLSEYVFMFKLASFALSFSLLTIVFGATFMFLPDVKIKFKDVLAGALFTSALFALSRFALSIYLTYSDIGSAFGAAGSLMVFLFFIFISMQLFFLGAEFTEIYARSRGNAFQLHEDAQWLPGRPRATETVLSTEPETETAKREKVGLTPSKR